MARPVDTCPECGGPDYVPHDLETCKKERAAFLRNTFGESHLRLFEYTDALMDALGRAGCHPGVYLRERHSRNHVYRAHVSAGGNSWAESSAPLTALKEAVRSWRRAGYPRED